ncbi:hypothetical protein ABFS82_04G115800 [Erythranthe guttata]
MERKTKVEEEEEIFYSPERIIEVNDEDENIKLGYLRAILDKQDPSCKDVDDLTLRRFLRARDLDAEKASRMFIKYLTWRRSFVPKGSISQSEVTNHIGINKMFMQGKDKRGCPLSIFFGGRHFPSKGGNDELKRFVVFVLDKLCSRIPDGEEKFTIIADLQGYGYSNNDARGYITAFSILQDYYPERLRKLFVIHVPYIFMAFWKIICPFIDKKTTKKVVFVEKERMHATFVEEIDENQLPEIYGGKLDLVPIQDG